MSTSRTRVDRCPGVLRPWAAADGLLVRLRLVGGVISPEALAALVEVSETYGDGLVHLTGRANLQVRGLPGADGALRPDALAALEATGLVPTRSHELVRNVMVSPQTGIAGGHVDLRSVAVELDRRLCADDRLAKLPGRFLIVLDDGRGDLVGRSCDLGLVALDHGHVQLRIGNGWGAIVPCAEAAGTLVRLASEFIVRRGSGPTAAWHVSELDPPLTPASSADPRLPPPADQLPYGPVAGGTHVAVPGGFLDRTHITELLHATSTVVVTPWRGVLVPEETR